MPADQNPRGSAGPAPTRRSGPTPLLARLRARRRGLTALPRALGSRPVTQAGQLALLRAVEHVDAGQALERLLAAAFELQAGYFAQHRLVELREQLDERRVGFDAAYRRYRTLAHAA